MLRLMIQEGFADAKPPVIRQDRVVHGDHANHATGPIRSRLPLHKLPHLARIINGAKFKFRARGYVAKRYPIGWFARIAREVKEQLAGHLEFSGDETSGRAYIRYS